MLPEGTIFPEPIGVAPRFREVPPLCLERLELARVDTPEAGT